MSPLFSLFANSPAGGRERGRISSVKQNGEDANEKENAVKGKPFAFPKLSIALGHPRVTLLVNDRGSSKRGPTPNPKKSHADSSFPNGHPSSVHYRYTYYYYYCNYGHGEKGGGKRGRMTDGRKWSKYGGERPLPPFWRTLQLSLSLSPSPPCLSISDDAILFPNPPPSPYGFNNECRKKHFGSRRVWTWDQRKIQDTRRFPQEKEEANSFCFPLFSPQTCGKRRKAITVV